ncbi:cytochrome C oxidase subunit IV family protein [Lysinibacillus sp. LZ02]|uniref:cytochrome C oxidase subunit IV family protein n=1 Tax=Lysinibacillus sp. LZ02 TaxID=3420668 RepID=UPI003D36F76B
MAHDTHFETRSQAQYEYDRAQNSKKMRKQVTQFAIMILLTFVAFSAVVADFAPNFIKPLVLLLAGIQVVQQLYSFMHMEEKDAPHMGVIQFFMWGGGFIAFTFFVCFLTIIWW